MFLLDSRMVPSGGGTRPIVVSRHRPRPIRQQKSGGHAENFETAPFRWRARRPGVQRWPAGLWSTREEPATKYPLMIYGNQEKWSSIPAGTAS